jgi:hypothetical protein
VPTISAALLRAYAFFHIKTENLRLVGLLRWGRIEQLLKLETGLEGNLRKWETGSESPPSS